MNIYKDMYLQLFNAVTTALRAMEKENYGWAETELKLAQQKCEEMFLECKEE
ncbi:MAG: hypothetical protein IJ339_05775 [Oscillospiraceae bacterium]|nr:hypothetical protein [Oscillospiraceae bacterium]